jgi:uncharacterized coiled-coil protein SlyX
MKTMISVSEFEQRIKSLEVIVAAQSKQIAEQQALIKFYEEHFKLSKRQQFGSSSEHTPEQLRFENMFN